jgi:subtilisin family serine protease
MNSVRRCTSLSKLFGLSLSPIPVVIACAILGAGNSQLFADSPQAIRQIRIHSQNETAGRAPGPKYHPNRLLVRYKKDVAAKTIQAMHIAVNARVLRELPVVRGLQSVQLPAGTSVSEALRYYRGNSNVLYAEPDYYVRAVGGPNDPQFSSQWSLNNTGQDGGTAGADIHALQAWTLTTGSSSVVVGVIDTGVDYNHQDLSTNIWSAPSGFSVTTQTGAIVQCPAGTHGFNMVADTCDPMDDNGHGSHVSGTIGAPGNNGIGVTGINWQVKILPCKFLDASGSGDTESAIACLGLMKQLKDSGVNIVITNNSWAGADASQSLHDAISSAMQDGMLFAAAAGNDFSNNDEFPTYPASFYLPNLIAVAATDRNDNVVTFSNTGRRTVHISAPGRDILSTTPNNTYGYDSGTSMATPHVAGVAALLKAQNPALDWRAIKNLILAGGDTLSAAQETISQKRLNAYGALTCTTGTVASRLMPIEDTISGSVGSPVTLAFLNIHCARPAGNVTVVVNPGNQSVTLTDDGAGADLAANDGIYTSQWTPSQPGSYTLAFPDGSTASVEILAPYGPIQTSYNYRTISGTNLNLGDDAVATIAAPFAIPFGGGSFTKLYVSSNGTISLTNPYDGFENFFLPPNGFTGTEIPPLTLVAPYWMDLYPVGGTNQNVFWAVTGSAPNRELIVEWRDVRAFACRADASATVTFQVVFKEGSNDVLFNYSDVVFGGACSNLDYGQFATTGVLSSSTQGSVWNVGAGPALNDGMALLWQSPPPVGSNNPVPTLASISPASVPLFSPDTVITVRGSNFVPTSVVQWENTNLAPLPPGIDLPTTYASSTQLSVVLPSAFAAPYNRYSIGTVQSLVVSNPAPGGGLSNTLPISISYPGVPSIASLTPSSASAGDFSFYMDVKGNNLIGAVIYWNGQMLFTFQISNTEVYAAVPSSLLAVAGTAQVTAVANVPNGGTSTSVSFTLGQAAAAVIGTAQEAAVQGIEHQIVESNGKTKSGAKPHRPVRFFGWNYGKQQGGSAYLKYFSRSYGMPYIPPKASTAGKEKPSAIAAASATSAVSLAQPATLPGFAFHQTLPAGFLPTSVATGDFNHDGKTDWVVSNGGTNDLWVYFGNGDGTAQLPRIIHLTGASPLQVVAADLRKIGVLDLVVAESDSQSIGVLLGNADGTFQPEVDYFVQGPPLSLAVGDVNGDGKPDVVAGIAGGGSNSGPLVTLLGDGTGKFGPPLVTSSIDDIGAYFTTTVVLKDLNGDGLMDALVIDEGGVVPGAHSYLSLGDGTFKHADYFSVSDPGAGSFITNVAAGDLDGDGCADAVTVEALGLVRVFKGTCDGGFWGFPNVVTLGAGEAPVSVAVADMNGDGNLDVVTGGGFFGVGAGVGEEASNLVTVLFGDGKGNLASPKVYRTAPSVFGLAVVDLNGDGKPEVISASQDTDKISVLLNDGQGNLDGPTGGYVGYITEGQQGAVNAPYSNFIVEDLNGDGKPDLAFVEAEQTYSSPWEFTVMLNDGTGHFSTPTRTAMADFTVPPAGYVLGDFRNTGRPDLVVSSSGYQGKENAVLVFVPNKGDGSFGKAEVTLLDLNQISGLGLIAAGDFNKDGKLDLVGMVVSPQSAPGVPAYELVTFAGNGDGTFRTAASLPFGSTVTSPPFMIFVGDYNRDGKLDVLVWTYDNIVGTQNHNVYEFLGNGDGTFAAPKLILPNFGFFGMADLNHDGYPDIVEFNQLPSAPPSGLDAPSFTVYIGQSDGTFKQGQTYFPYSGSVYPGYGFSNVGINQILTPMLADFNGDGNIDVGVVMLTPYPLAKSYMQVLAGNGDGTFTPTYEVIPFDKFGLPTNAADVDGDGRADLLELDGWPSSFHVIRGVPGPTVQLALASQPIIGSKGSLIVNLSLVPANSTTVQLSASDANINIPATVTIPSGSLSMTVPFTIGPTFDSSRVFSLSAQLSGQTSTIYSYKASSGVVGIHLFANSVKETTPPSGTTMDYAIGMVSLGGYSTTVQYSCQGLPAAATCVFGTNPQPLPSGGGVGNSLTIQTSSTTPLGSYTVTLLASDGAVSDQMKLTLNVADFSISVTPTSATVLTGGTANFSLQLGSISGWTDLISVNCTLTGSMKLGCGAVGTYFAGNFPFTVPTNGLAPGDYSLSVSGSADGVTHAAPTVVLHIQGATASVSPTSATLPVGSSKTFNVTINSQAGFTDQFSFGCPALPVGVSCTFAPTSGTLPANGILTSVLTVTVTSRPIAAVPGFEGSRRNSRWFPILLLTLLAIQFGITRRTKVLGGAAWKPVMDGVPAYVFLLLALTMYACGGATSNISPPPPPPPQPVTFSFTVQATSPSLVVNAGTITVQVN